MSNTSTLFTPVNATPARAATAATLLTSARPPTDPDARWELGMAWRPEICVQISAYDYCADTGSTLPADDVNALVYYRPILLRVDFVCSTLYLRPADTDRARRQLDAATGAQLAAELWTGAVTHANPFTAPTGTQTENASFSRGFAGTLPTVVSPSGGFTSSIEAVGALTQAARTALNGQQCYLHIPDTLAQLDPYNWRRVGDLLYTEQDDIVVVDAGYPGTGPAGDSTTGVAWMYATGPVTVRLGDIDVVDDDRVILNRQTNRLEAWAHRPVAATFDPCVLYAAAVKIPT